MGYNTPKQTVSQFQLKDRYARQYLSFAGKSSKDFLLYLSGPGVYDSPAADVESTSVPGRNGDILTENAKAGRRRYQNVDIKYKVFFFNGLPAKTAAVKAWLLSPVGYQKLQDTYDPDFFRMAVCKDALAFDVTAQKAAEMELAFNCKPQRWSVDGQRTIRLDGRSTLKNPFAFPAQPTEQPQEYKEKELEIPEGVFQIRASSYAKDLNLKVCGESAKLWNQVQRERQNQKKMAVEIEALRSADDALAKETMTSLEYPDIIVILMSIDETGTYFPAKYPEYRASEITLGGLHSKNVSIYQYFCDELQDEANGVYVCSGHLIQPAVESYPTLDYVSADSVGRQSGRVLHMAYGRGQYGGPNWHPNNYAHCAWGYQLYALVKYTLALQDMK